MTDRQAKWAMFILTIMFGFILTVIALNSSDGPTVLTPQQKITREDDPGWDCSTMGNRCCDKVCETDQ